MANKKTIGAYIVLDGDKEFRQSVTNCNKTLTTLKSEMSLVKAECEGQANSLESLKKKHEILGKTLAAHKEKEEAIKKAHEHSKESYEKVKNQLNDYKGELEKAKDTLKELENNASSTDQELNKQKEVVEKLSNIVKKGEETYERAGNKIKDWETKLNTAKAQTIKATQALNENAAYMKEAEQSTDKCAKSIDEFGKKVQETAEVTMDFSTILIDNLCEKALDVAAEALQSLGNELLSVEKAEKQLQASTGLTTLEMKSYKTAMDELYKNNYGEDMGDIANSIALIKQYTNGIDTSKIKEMTEDGMTMQEVFNMDLSETIRGVNTMINEMGVSSEEAFDLMAKGAQNGLNKSGELADNIAEYGPLWTQAGFSAQEMFAIMENGLNSGAYNLDKVNDFVKEFSISLADGRIEENLDSFSEETAALFYQWQIGKATTKDVFHSVINDLNNTANKQKALTLASNTWSSLGEDNALKVITSLNKVNDAYDNVQGTMEQIKEVKFDTLEDRIQTLGRRAMSDLVEPVAEKALPSIEKGLDGIIENTDTIISYTKVAVAGLLTYKTASIAIDTYKTAADMAANSQKILNVVMNANPAILLATGVAAVGTALTVMASHAREASKETKILCEESEKLTEEVATLSSEMQQSKTDWEDTAYYMYDQKTAAYDLVKELYELEKQEHRTTEQNQRMKIVVSELNQMIPNLALAINEETGELNQNRKTVEKSIEASLLYQKTKAAEAKLAEISKELVDAELKKYEVERKNEEISKRLNEIQEEKNELQKETIAVVDTYGNVISNTAEKELLLAEEEHNLRTQQDENKESLKELQQNYEELNATYTTVEEYMQTQIDRSNEMSGAYNDAGKAAESSAEVQKAAAESLGRQVTEDYNEMQQTLADVLENQMSMFEKFDAGTKLSTEKLLSNMQSQLDGVSNWADNLAELADRGINQNLLTYLSELGPEGAAYVATFADMSDAELKRANDMWAESLNMKSGVEESVQGMLESYVTALNGGKDAVVQASANIADGTVQGLVNEINSRMSEVGTVGEETGTTVVEGMADGAGTHSPSTKTKAIGKGVIDGLVLGIKETSNQAEKTASDLAKSIIQKMDDNLQGTKFVKTGKRIANSLATGINTGKPTVLMAADTLARSAYNRASNIESLYTVGLNVSLGLASGILAGRSQVINATANVCAAAVRQAKSDLEIHSPSKVFEDIGYNMAEGQGIGYQKGAEKLNEMITESVELPKITYNTEAYRSSNQILYGTDYGQLVQMFRESTRDAVKMALKEAYVSVELDGRKLDRGLRSRGVVYG